MAQYYANIEGNHGAATRMGTKSSGMSGHIRGWNVGCRVWMSHNDTTDQDECTVCVTSGSNGHGGHINLGTFTAADLDKPAPTPIDHKAIAEIVRRAKGDAFGIEVPAVMKCVAVNMADYFTQDNPQFDRGRFLEACGL